MVMAHPAEAQRTSASPCDTKRPLPRSARGAMLLFTCRDAGLLRLAPEDLGEPERYRQRLEAWILEQK
ncbi:MAG: hypothetical protein BWY56_01385 [Acidobacteria bacterium ADurb.Bin340]|nr:MAG: hypothetical protein BWY56_01385 [Acidobacteria bacterium ADurb.Bin340]